MVVEVSATRETVRGEETKKKKRPRKSEGEKSGSRKIERVEKLEKYK